MIELPRTRTGLAAMTVGAASGAGGHLVLADWLEEHLNRPDLAAIYRLTKDDARDKTECERTRYFDFRYQFLDAEVMLGRGQPLSEGEGDRSTDGKWPEEE